MIVPKKYRILRKSHRSQSTGEVKHSYHVEYLNEFKISQRRWWRKTGIEEVKQEWKPVVKTHYYSVLSDISFDEDVKFDELKDAYKYCKNLCEVVPAPKVIKEYPGIGSGGGRAGGHGSGGGHMGFKEMGVIRD